MIRRRVLSIVCAALTVACTKTAPPRALSPRGLANVTAFTTALGYVRFFHPTEAAAGVNWDAFAVRSIRVIEGAVSDDSLASALTSVFAPITSNVRFARTGTPLPTTIAKPAGATHVMFWRHLGLGAPDGARASSSNNAYRSERVVAPLGEIGRPIALPNDYGGVPVSLPPVPDPSRPLLVPLGGGVSMSIPIGLFTDAEVVDGSRRSPLPSFVAERFSTNDRATRLADVALAWSLFAHFYPYFGVVQTDWPAALDAALRSAATDTSPDAFHATLQRLVVALHDGHGYVTSAAVPLHTHDAQFRWLDGHVLVTAIGDSAKASGLRIGDEVLTVDGRPVQARLEELSARSSGATAEFIRWRALLALLNGDPRTRALLHVSGTDGVTRDVALTRVPKVDVNTSVDSVAEIAPGVMYVNLERITQPVFDSVMPRLQHAKAVIFDMRGYPRHVGVQKLFSHLSDSVMRSPRLMIPVTTMPDHQHPGFVDVSWTVAPAPPRLSARIIFLSGAGAVSAAETVLGLVEGNRLGDIVGETSAGTNGISRAFELPGGYTVNWTTLLVQKQDGTPHHGVGIIPTVPVAPTVAGVRAGRDEVLERAVALATRGTTP